MFLIMRDKRRLLADWVRSERTRPDRNWSQTDLADRMGKVKSVVNKIESGSNEATLETLALLAKVFGYPVTVVLDLLGYDVNMGDDQWVEGMNHKMGQLDPAKRPIAERLLNALLEEDVTVPAVKKVKSKA